MKRCQSGEDGENVLTMQQTASCDAALSRNRNTLGRGTVRAMLGARVLEP